MNKHVNMDTSFPFPKVEVKGIELKHSVILAIGTNTYLFDDLKEIYQRDPQYYYKLYKESKHYDAVLFSSYPAYVEEYLHYATAIYEAAYATEDFTDLLRLFKKGYKWIYNLVKNSGEIVDEMSFLNRLNNQMVKMKEHPYSGLEIICHMTAFYYLSKHMEKLVRSIDNPFHDMFNSYLHERTAEVENRQQYKQEALVDLKPLIHHLKDSFLQHKSKSISFEDFTERIIHSELSQMAKEEQIDMIDFDRDSVFESGYYAKYIGFYSTILKMEGVGEDVLNSISLSQDEFDEICYYAMNATASSAIPTSEIPHLLVATSFIKTFVKEYKDVRHRYLTQDKEDAFYSIEQEKEKIRNEVREKESKAEQALRQMASYELRLKASDDTLVKMRKELNEKEAELQRLKKDMAQKEKEHFAELKRLQPVSSITEEEHLTVLRDLKRQVIQSKQIAIVGGYQKWQQRIAEVIPTITFVDIDAKGANLDFLGNSDLYVVINTEYNSHSFMKKVHSILDKQHKKYFNLNGNFSVQRTIDELYAFITGANESVSKCK